MACSKLFSGDLPEISSYIIQNLHNNVNTLYSLALVNRFWCRLAIPLLWENPFSVKRRENLSSHFIDIYFLFLSDSDKSQMKTQFYSKFDSNLHKPLFNYPSLIKTINFCRIELHVEYWLSTSSVQQSSNKKSCLQLINLQIERFKEANEEEMEVCTALLRLFMENNASLNYLYMNNHYNYRFLNQFYDMVLNHPKFISEIENFSFSYYNCVDNLISTQTFLSSLTSLLPNSIKHIHLSAGRTEFENDFAKIMQSQTHLSSVKFCYPKILNSLNHSSNTLTSINFYQCHFYDDNTTIRFDALSYLTQLESFQFKYSHGINNVIQPLLSITTPLKIKTFVFFDSKNLIEDLTPIRLLIQKIGSYIENLVLGIHNNELRRKIFDMIIDFCEKIKFLHLIWIYLKNISQLSKIISNSNDYLKYLTLEVKSCDYRHDFYGSSRILSVLSKSLPLSLHYLDLKLYIIPDDLQIVFENCKQVELKKLLIRNWSINSIDTTLKVIKDFVKEKKLEFLAYYILDDHLFTRGKLCHNDLEKLVKEVQSFTKMVRYDDLVIGISEIDGSLMRD